jgi:hypothetical protein
LKTYLCIGSFPEGPDIAACDGIAKGHDLRVDLADNLIDRAEAIDAAAVRPLQALR